MISTYNELFDFVIPELLQPRYRPACVVAVVAYRDHEPGARFGDKPALFTANHAVSRRRLAYLSLNVAALLGISYSRFKHPLSPGSLNAMTYNADNNTIAAPVSENRPRFVEWKSS